MSVAQRLAAVQEKVAAAQARSTYGQRVTLVGVSKKQPMSKILEARAAGLLDFGENYAQELREKADAITDEPAARWHYIGPLQSNKVKLVAGVHLIHTIDRAKLLTKLENRAEHQDVLIQVNVAAEPQKAGIAPAELPALLDRFSDLDHVRCRGLMIIPPVGTPEETRPYFAALRALRDEHAAKARPSVELEELSMGMSSDFEVAIEEGATLVRVGTAVFGPRET